MEVEETRLPGVGLRHDFLTAEGQRIGVVSQRGGERQVFVYDSDDPDACRAVIDLSAAEAEVVAELLGAPRIVERFARLREQVEGLATEGIRLAASSPYARRTLGDAQVRTRTGASIVAVIRGDEVHPSPRPDFTFEAGDKVIVVGTPEAVRQVAQILAEG
ncbi:cation:proton antiporter regulatory subunit [Actinopolymorpha alba]|uniref:cation:proton antiporter regulatory subunit n=1 Tax=Actinopolymorpha alba TaxID=533267 RepID=UPI00037A711A|nr:cation:proton antiporter regulatory subunit [Actinopolymorpha alba]